MNWEKLLNNNRLRQSNRKNRKDARNDFESDFGRIIFSPALRRMHDKTQVFPLTTDDNIHSRLTHSMEVMSVGYSLGVKLCESDVLLRRLEKDKYELFREIPVILKNCCLVHDIGNPPFGHFGETVIRNYFSDFFRLGSDTGQSEVNAKTKRPEISLTSEQELDFLNFDGNAQGLRVLTKLQMLNDSYGLNLTFSTLASYIKYPNFAEISDSFIESRKHGVFYSEKEYFNTIAEECNLVIGGRIVRHPLCYLMEAADSICYLTMDIEDGYNKGLVNLAFLYDELKDLPSLGSKLKEIFEDKEGYYKNDLTKMVNFRIQIIQTLVLLAIDNFENNLDKIEKGEYNNELIFDDPDNQLAEKLRRICKENIFSYRDINSLELTGDSVIRGLLDYYIRFVFHKDKNYNKRATALISSSVLNVAFEECSLYGKDARIENLSDYYKLRIVVDFISGMTDQYALNHYQKISGQRI